MGERKIIPVCDWPAADRLLWEGGIRPPLFLDEASVAARWREKTIAGTAACYGRWLAYLRDQGLLDAGVNPEVRFTRKRVLDYVCELQHVNRPATVLHRIIGLERAFAVLVPSMDRSTLRIVSNNLAADYSPPSKREKIYESAVLANVGCNLMEASMRAFRSRARYRHAIYRDGLQIALLAMRPLRLKNFASIQIGTNLRRQGRAWRLAFDGLETKNHKNIDVEFPNDLVNYLDHYLEIIRPRLCGRRYAGDAMWISLQAQQQHEASLRYQIKQRTREALGMAITPHLFRDCAATSLAIHNPEEVQIAHHVLGNSYTEMESTYNQARMIDAAVHYHATLGARRMRFSDLVS